MTLQLLQGLRVLDLSSMVPGDAATALLADLGAEVVKLESPPAGDRIRDIEPLAVEARVSVRHLALNRNKRSIGVDLRRSGGREVFLDLVRWADAVFDVSPPGLRDRIGAGYSDCASARPDTVYCSLTAYGFARSLTDAPAHSVGPEAMSGLLRPVGEGDEIALRVPPVRVPAFASALAAALAVVAGVRYRDTTGRGVWVETSQLRVGVWWQQLEAFEELNRVEVAHRVPEGGAGARYNFYAAADGGVLLLTPIERRSWDRFAGAVGRPDWRGRGDWDEGGLDFGSGDLALAREIASLIAGRDRDDWLSLFAGAAVPAVPAMSAGELLRAPEGRDLLLTSDDPRVGRLQMVAPPIGVSGVAPGAARPAPDPGSDGPAILAEIGYPPSRVAELAAAGALFGPAVPA